MKKELDELANDELVTVTGGTSDMSLNNVLQKSGYPSPQLPQNPIDGHDDTNDSKPKNRDIAM